MRRFSLALFPPLFVCWSLLEFLFLFFSSPFVGVVSFEAGRGTPCRHGDLTGGGNPAHRPQNAGPTIAAMWGASQKNPPGLQGKANCTDLPVFMQTSLLPPGWFRQQRGVRHRKTGYKKEGGGNLQKKPPLSLQAETLSKHTKRMGQPSA